MKRNNRKTVTSQGPSNPKVLNRGSEISARLPSDYSHPTLKVKGVEEYRRTISIDVQMTIRSKVEFTRRQLCILSGISLFEIAKEGLSLSDWIILEYLYSSLLGNKQSPYERKHPMEFELALILKVVLLSGTWMGLEEKIQLPEDVRLLILSSKFVPSERTYSSWKQSWQIEKFIEFRIVPLDVLLERSSNTIPYSSYCKGYGESSRMGRRRKTRPSAELDGEEVDLEKDKMMNLDLLRLSHLLTAVLLETKYTKNK